MTDDQIRSLLARQPCAETLDMHLVDFARGEAVREVLRQVAVYAGFPAAWNALATMKAALKDFDEAAS